MRNQILSSNIANADTPNYKARDFDFQSAMQAARGESVRLMRTNEMHMESGGTERYGTDVQYRIPMQPTLDGNTVETDVEQAAFAENAVHYRAALSFLNGSIRTLKFSLRGSD